MFLVLYCVNIKLLSFKAIIVPSIGTLYSVIHYCGMGVNIYHLLVRRYVIRMILNSKDTSGQWTSHKVPIVRPRKGKLFSLALMTQSVMQKRNFVSNK